MFHEEQLVNEKYRKPYFQYFALRDDQKIISEI